MSRELLSQVLDKKKSENVITPIGQIEIGFCFSTGTISRLHVYSMNLNSAKRQHKLIRLSDAKTTERYCNK